ncbi:hypothetical protein ACFQ8O_33925 [Streptomyces coelicoflavus]|uniref:hypothetical protein n=1 Tax=Streptomyces coelicoflavus TaxID=285562 RepID=UPI0036A261ED
MNHATTPMRPTDPGMGYSRRLSETEALALTAFAVPETACAIAFSPRHSDVIVTAAGPRIVKRVPQEGRP